jgi:branched-chain amino acid transport system permease protein
MYLPTGTFNETYKQDMAIIRHREHWMVIVFLFIICTLLFLFVSDSILGIINLMGITIISALGLQFLLGFAGQISTAHAAFMAVGAYTSAILAVNGIPFGFSIICASFVSGIVGIMFGWPSIRIKGFYLLMSTFAAQLIIIYSIDNVLVSLTRGTLGHSAPSPRIGEFIINTERRWFILIISILVVSTLVLNNLKRTKVGRAAIAIRDNDLAAEVMGICLWRYKLLAFFICCCYAGLAGALYAHWQSSVVSEAFDLMQSIWYLGYLIVGGLGSIAGCFFGVILIIALQEGVTRLFSSLGSSYPEAINMISTTRPIFFGVVVALFLIFEPRGLAHRWEVVKTYYRSWPFPYISKE